MRPSPSVTIQVPGAEDVPDQGRCHQETRGRADCGLVLVTAALSVLLSLALILPSLYIILRSVAVSVSRVWAHTPLISPITRPRTVHILSTKCIEWLRENNDIMSEVNGSKGRLQKLVDICLYLAFFRRFRSLKFLDPEDL